MESEEDEKPTNFHEMELDDRILKAIAKLGWCEPTLIQEKAIPLMLEGKDMLIRARTGSGKTGAFAIPLIQKILNAKQVAAEQAVLALILAPTRELCHQIYSHFVQLTIKCSREVSCVDISPQLSVKAQRPILVDLPDVVIATPSRALLHLKAETLKLDSLQMLVIDEADLVFSFGYEADMKQVLRYLPRVCQTALSSATLSEDVLSLKKLALHNPVILKLQEPDVAPTSQLTHYHLAAEELEKATILYSLVKLNLVRGKTIVFVNTVDKCYKIKLYLEQFGIPACVLNSEMPAKVRCHAVGQFNQGLYDIIVASDEKALEEPAAPPAKSKKRKEDKESGVSRGIDFQFVSNVINFDFPLDVNSYVHRVGRTARGSNKGTALSFFNIEERVQMEKVEKYLQERLSEVGEGVFKKYEFRLSEVEGFRYRATDAWRSVTKIAIKEARVKEIKREILNSEKLKGYFEDNPKDLNVLRHDKKLSTVAVQPHLADIPDYIVPESLKGIAVPQRKRRKLMKDYRKSTVRPELTAQAKYQKLKNDPLMSMEFTGFKKKK